MTTVRGARNKTAGGGARCRYRLQERKEKDDREGKKSWGLEERSGVGWPDGLSEGGALRSGCGGSCQCCHSEGGNETTWAVPVNGKLSGAPHQAGWVVGN